MIEIENDKRTQVRMPTDIHRWLTHRAKQNDRSMNAELIRIVRQAMEATKKQATAINENALQH